MIQSFPFDSSTDRSAGEMREISAPAGAWLAFTGATPPDLVVTALDSTGAPTIENVPVTAGDQLRVQFARIVLTHAPNPAGGSFAVFVSYDPDRFEPAPRGVASLRRIGSGVYDLTTDRLPTIFASSAINLTAGGFTVIYNAPAKKAWRLLRSRIILSGSTTFAANDVDLAFGLWDGLNYVGGELRLPRRTTAATAGMLFDTGIVDYGVGITAPGQNTGLLFAWGAAAAAGSAVVQAWISLD